MERLYVVKLSSLDRNGDYQYLTIELKSLNEDSALNKAIDYYYKEYWSNCEWRKDEFEIEVRSFINKIDKLSDEVLLKHIPNKDIIINEYKSLLRQELGSTDKTLEEFNRLSINGKISYLFDIGCELSYFVFPKSSKFEKVKIN